METQTKIENFLKSEMKELRIINWSTKLIAVILIILVNVSIAIANDAL